MALFDGMNPALAQNGQGPPNAPGNISPPGFNAGFGNAPPNLAGGLQQFMNPQFLAMLQAQRARQPALPGMPAQLGGPAGTLGAPGNSGPQPAPPMGSSVPTTGGAEPVPQGMGQMMNLAGGLNPFLRR